MWPDARASILTHGQLILMTSSSGSTRFLWIILFWWVCKTLYTAKAPVVMIISVVHMWFWNVCFNFFSLFNQCSFDESQLIAIPKFGKKRSATIVNHRKRLAESLNVAQSRLEQQQPNQQFPFADLYQLVHLKGCLTVGVLLCPVFISFQ